MRKPVYAICEQKGADQPAHPRSLISAFIVRCPSSIISILAKSKSFKTLAVFFGCADRLESTLVRKPEDSFFRDEAHFSFDVSHYTEDMFCSPVGARYTNQWKEFIIYIEYKKTLMRIITLLKSF